MRSSSAYRGSYVYVSGIDSFLAWSEKHNFFTSTDFKFRSHLLPNSLLWKHCISEIFTVNWGSSLKSQRTAIIEMLLLLILFRNFSKFYRCGELKLTFHFEDKLGVSALGVFKKAGESFLYSKFLLSKYLPFRKLWFTKADEGYKICSELHGPVCL